MHPLLAGRHRHRLDRRPARAGDFDADRRSDAAAQVARAPARRGVPVLARTTRPARRSPLDVVEAVLDVAPGMVIVDEAYAEFARPGTPSALTLLPEHPRLVVTRTMSKAFALAGGRGSATWRPTRRWSTPCSWCGCRTTCRR